MTTYLPAFIISFGVSVATTLIVRKIAVFAGFLDKPDQLRKLHAKPIALLGGLSIFLSFFLVLSFYLPHLIAGDLDTRHWIGFFLGAILITVGGAIDDRSNLRPGLQILFPLVAIICVLMSGIGIEKISNPIHGGHIFLDKPAVSYELFGQIIDIALWSGLIISLWLMGMMYTTKLLDGVDGLVSGLTVIGALIIFLFTNSQTYYQPDIALASLILAASFLGFLLFNWNPASIFLGESGSLLAGYTLGVLAIISGGKFAIALLVMGIPILDLLWTILRRLASGQNPFRVSDRGHLHFRLLDSGLGPRKTVAIYYLLALSFGGSALFLQTGGKLIALALLLVVTTSCIYLFSNRISK